MIKKTKTASATPVKKAVKKTASKKAAVTASPTKSKKLTVDEFMNESKHPLKKEIEALRTIIKKANKKISEQVKWNAPSYFYIKDMAAFNLHQQKFVQLIFIFPFGLIAENELLEGIWKDRREVRFYDMKDVKAKKTVLEKIVNEWVTLADTIN